MDKRVLLAWCLFGTLIGSFISNFYRFSPWIFVGSWKWIDRYSGDPTRKLNATFSLGMYYSIVCFKGESRCHTITQADRRNDLVVIFSQDIANEWYTLRQLQMTVETFSLLANVVGVAAAVVTIVKKYEHHQKSFIVISATFLIVSGILQIGNLVPLVTGPVRKRMYSKDGVVTVGFPFSVPFGFIGSSILIIIGFIYNFIVFIPFKSRTLNRATCSYRLLEDNEEEEV